MAKSLITVGAQIVGWLLLAALAVATIGPLNYRPVVSADPDLERFVIFSAVGLCFSFGYPRSPWIILAALFALIATLEALQFLVPGRHGQLHDVVIKASGVLLGVGVGMAIAAITARYHSDHRP